MLCTSQGSTKRSWIGICQRLLWEGQGPCVVETRQSATVKRCLKPCETAIKTTKRPHEANGTGGSGCGVHAKIKGDWKQLGDGAIFKSQSFGLRLKLEWVFFKHRHVEHCNTLEVGDSWSHGQSWLSWGLTAYRTRFVAHDKGKRKDSTSGVEAVLDSWARGKSKAKSVRFVPMLCHLCENHGTDSDESTDFEPWFSGFHAAGLEALDRLGQGVLGIKRTTTNSNKHNGKTSKKGRENADFLGGFVNRRNKGTLSLSASDTRNAHAATVATKGSSCSYEDGPRVIGVASFMEPVGFYSSSECFQEG